MQKLTHLTVCEIFTSLLGESTLAGLPAFFIRLAGCNLRCRWCDTPYAQAGGEEQALNDLVAAALTSQTRLVLVTGGEPLLQAGTRTLLDKLSETGLEVLLETNGSLPIQGLPPGVRRIVDVKCPSSGMDDHNLWGNLEVLTLRDEVKLVIAHRDDFTWALQVIDQYQLAGRLPVLISPVFGEVSLPEVAAWILESRLPLRLNLQLHKYIWGPEARGV